MIIKFIYLAQKSFLYVGSMAFALTITYYLGLYPLLNAQAGAEVVSGAMKQSEASETEGAKEGISDVNTDKQQLNLPTNSKFSDEELNRAAIDLQKKTNYLSEGVEGSNQSHLQKSEQAGASTGTSFKYTQSYIGDMDSPERDPFRKPEYLLRLEDEEGAPKAPVDVFVMDNKMEAIRRWPISEYQLIGVIWDVKNPKAMIQDPAKTKHLLKRNYRIGNKNGLVSEIGEGSITVLQDGVPVVISMSGEKK